MLLTDFVFLYYLADFNVRFYDSINNQIGDLLTHAKSKDTGVEVKDRRRRLKQYKQCFIISELITWLCTHLNTRRQVALRIAEFIQEKGYIEHVSRKHISVMDADILFHFSEPKTTTIRTYMTTSSSVPIQRSSTTPITPRLEPSVPKLIIRRKTDNNVDRILGSLLAKTPIYFGSADQFAADKEEEEGEEGRRVCLHIKSIRFYEVAKNVLDVTSKTPRSYTKKTTTTTSVKYYYKIVVDDQVSTSEVCEDLLRWTDSYKMPVKNLPATVFIVLLVMDKPKREDLIGYAKLRLNSIGSYNIEKVNLQNAAGEAVTPVLHAVMSCEYE
jgi:hypothetical protein